MNDSPRDRGALEQLPFQVGPGMMVTLRFALFDQDDEPVEVPGGEEESSFAFGFGELLPALEQALYGAMVGEHRSVALRAEDAYGRRDEAEVIEVDRAEFPEGAEPGDTFEAENAVGQVVLLTVLETTEERVVVDGNHPLAGQDVRFEVEVLGGTASDRGGDGRGGSPAGSRRRRTRRCSVTGGALAQGGERALTMRAAASDPSHRPVRARGNPRRRR